MGTGTLKQQDRGQHGHVTGGGLLCTMRALGRPGVLDLYPRVGSFLEERGKARGVRMSGHPGVTSRGDIKGQFLLYGEV